MNDPLAKWHQEHLNFARLLDMLERQLEEFHRSAAPNYDLMIDVMYYMTHFPDLFHHPREDLAFERIQARDASARPVTAALIEQHRLLRRDGDALLAQLDDIVNGGIRNRESVERAARAYIDLFRNHMETEERTIVPAAKKLLMAQDWSEIDATIDDRADPLFGGAVPERYAALGEQISREAALAGR